MDPVPCKTYYYYKGLHICIPRRVYFTMIFITILQSLICKSNKTIPLCVGIILFSVLEWPPPPLQPPRSSTLKRYWISYLVWFNIRYWYWLWKYLSKSGWSDLKNPNVMFAHLSLSFAYYPLWDKTIHRSSWSDGFLNLGFYCEQNMHG